MTKQEIKTEVKQQLPWWLMFLLNTIVEFIYKFMNQPNDQKPTYPQDGSEVQTEDKPN